MPIMATSNHNQSYKNNFENLFEINCRNRERSEKCWRIIVKGSKNLSTQWEVASLALDLQTSKVSERVGCLIQRTTPSIFSSRQTLRRDQTSANQMNSCAHRSKQTPGRYKQWHKSSNWNIQVWKTTNHSTSMSIFSISAVQSWLCKCHKWSQHLHQWYIFLRYPLLSLSVSRPMNVTKVVGVGLKFRKSNGMALFVRASFGVSAASVNVFY